MKKIQITMIALLISLIFVGCGNQVEGNAEHTDKQTATAMENQAEDKFDQILKEQKRLYQEALNEMENQNNRRALALAQEAAERMDGSKELNAKAVELMEEIQAGIDRQRAEKQAKIEVEAATVEVSSTEAYTYADFKGIYAMYEGEPYHSKIVVTTILSDQYLTDIVADWMEYTAAKIASVQVEGDVLHIDYEGEAEGPITYSTGTFTAQLHVEENGEKVLSVDDHTFYPLTREQFNTLGYELDEELFNGF